MKVQLQAFCLAITAAFPCDEEVPPAVTILGLTLFPKCGCCMPIKEAMDRLQKDLDATIAEKEEVSKEHSRVLEKFAKLKDAVYSERDKAAKAEARACKAEALAGKGAFDPKVSRVLHMTDSPITEALKHEISVLRRQVESLTGTRPKAGSSMELDPNKYHQRLKESFKEQISCFREGVYMMTGYKIDMVPGNDRPTFRVRSLFAESEHGTLSFSWHFRCTEQE